MEMSTMESTLSMSDDYSSMFFNETSVDNVTFDFNATETIVPTLDLFCTSDDWNNFQKSYRPIHGCSSIIVCIFGSIANIINIIVLTRQSMISPTNAILTALAITDLLVMVEYIPYTLHIYIMTDRILKERYSWGWSAFVLFHAHFGQVFHTISISLTLTLAVWRYIAIGYPQHNTVWCSMSRCHVAIAACFAFSLFFNVPNYMALKITNIINNNETLYLVKLAETDKTLATINFIVYSVILKLLPCAALTGLSLALIKELLKAASRRAALMKRPQNGKKADAEKQADRVTKMLLAILILFLVSEVPQGILGMLYVIPNFGFDNCYEKLGDVMDMLVLFNSAVNFLLYCSMSQQFRDTFTRLFTPCCDIVINSAVVKHWRRTGASIPGEPTEAPNDCSTTCVTHV